VSRRERERDAVNARVADGRKDISVKGKIRPAKLRLSKSNPDPLVQGDRRPPRMEASLVF
jgi:hypothetical protein